jgi:co-chaperonin GroES (HSP10)
MTNIEPFGSLVLVEEIDQGEKKTASGLVLTSTVMDSNIKRGKVIAIGSGDFDANGNKHEIPLTAGDIVIYNENQATEVTDALNDKYHFINWRHLFGKEGSLNG